MNPGAAGRGAVRAVAVLEAAKGLVVLLAGLGLLALVHRDVQEFAERLVAHAHLNPASRYPRIFLDFAGKVTDTRLMLLAAGALGYSLVRFAEAYGLWRERAWAEWLAAGAGAIYLPFEVLEFLERRSWPGAAVFAVNLLIVAIMLHAISRRRAGAGR